MGLQTNYKLYDAGEYLATWIIEKSNRFQIQICKGQTIERGTTY